MKTATNVLYEDENIRVKTSGHDFDFIATIENKTPMPIILTFWDDTEGYRIAPNDWVGLTADEEGERILAAIKADEFDEDFDI